VLRLACTSELDRNAGGILAAGRATHAGQVLDEVPDKEGHPGPPGWRLGVRLTSSPHKNLGKGGSHGLNMNQRATGIIIIVILIIMRRGEFLPLHRILSSTAHDSEFQIRSCYFRKLIFRRRVS
jgi:hypothetical protein